MDGGNARSKNEPWLKPELRDERWRYDVRTFNITGDSAYVMIYHYNLVTDCHYKLKNDGKEWRLTFESCGSE